MQLVNVAYCFFDNRYLQQDKTRSSALPQKTPSTIRKIARYQIWDQKVVGSNASQAAMMRLLLGWVTVSEQMNHFGI